MNQSITAYTKILTEIMKDILPKHNYVETPMQKVKNQILEIREQSVVVRSSRTNKPRTVYFSEFYKIWQKEIDNISQEKIGRINHGRVIQAIFLLHPTIGYNDVSQTITLLK